MLLAGVLLVGIMQGSVFAAQEDFVGDNGFSEVIIQEESEESYAQEQGSAQAEVPDGSAQYAEAAGQQIENAGIMKSEDLAPYTADTFVGGSEASEPAEEAFESAAAILEESEDSDASAPIEAVSESASVETSSESTDAAVDAVSESAYAVSEPIDASSESAGEVSEPIDAVSESSGEVSEPIDAASESAAAVSEPIDAVSESAGEVSEPAAQLQEQNEAEEQPQEHEEEQELLQEQSQKPEEDQEEEEELPGLPEVVPEDEILNVIPAVAASLSTEGTQSADNVEDALEYVREQMYVRAETVSIQVPESVCLQLDLKAYHDLTAHTGDPRGGDYLRDAIWAIWGGYQEQDDGTVVVEYNMVYHDSAEEEAEADAETARLVSALGLKSSAKNDYDKVKAIHDYIVENVEYDYDTYYGRRDDYTQTYCGYGAIVRHLAVCQGISSMFYRLALEAGIDSRTISSKELKHEWNIVQLEGLYYLVDCTWDENSQTDNFFLRGKKDFADHGKIYDEYQDEAFADSHPLSDYKYGFSLKYYGDAPDYTLLTWDRKTISTSAKDGRAKLFLFFFEGCPYTEPILESLRGKSFAGVDFIYAYMLNGKEEQENILSEIGKSLPLDVPGTYAVSSNNSEVLREMEQITGIKDPDGYIYSPTVFMVNADNQIVFAQHGNPGDIELMVRDFLENPDAPDVPVQEDFGAFTAMGCCGDTAVWRFYEDGTLRISGEGKLWDNTYWTTVIGWVDDKDCTEEYSLVYDNIRGDSVRKVIIDSGITHLGLVLFRHFTNLESVTFCGAVPHIDYQDLDHEIDVYYPDTEDISNNENRFNISRNSSTRWISLDADGVHHHKWSAWKTTEAATVQAEGTKERTCTECLEKETAKIPKRDPVSIKGATVTFPSSIVFNGTAQKPAPTVKKGTTTLKAGKDYTITYSNNIHPGKAKTVITGIGNYTGTIETTFTIKKANQTITVKAAASAVAVGKTTMINVTGAKGTKTFAAENVRANIATVDKTGKVTAKRVGKIKITVTSAATTDYNKATKSVTINIVPAATTRFTAENLTKNNISQGINLTWEKVTGATGYTLYRDNKPVKTITNGNTLNWIDTAAKTNGAKYTYKIVAKASTGNSTLSKAINTYYVACPVFNTPKNTKSKIVTATWKKNNKANGYEIQCTSDSNFKSGIKTVTVADSSIESKDFSVAKKIKYFTCIRAYKKVGSTKYYSAWSPVKSIVITK